MPPSNKTGSVYTPELEARIAAWATTQVEPERLAHVKGVVSTAAEMARRYAPEDEARARLAGWIHDVAKGWSDDELLAFARARGLPVTPGERQVPMLLHGLVGYVLAAEAFALDDPALRQACALHTTGGPGMTALDKIVFLADLIEPGREFPGVEALREEAARDLDRAMLRGLDQTIRYLIDGQRYIDTRAVEARNALIARGVRYGQGAGAKDKD